MTPSTAARISHKVAAFISVAWAKLSESNVRRLAMRSIGISRLQSKAFRDVDTTTLIRLAAYKRGISPWLSAHAEPIELVLSELIEVTQTGKSLLCYLHMREQGASHKAIIDAREKSQMMAI